MLTQSLTFGSANKGIVHSLAHNPVVLSPYVPDEQICVQLPVAKSAKNPIVHDLMQLFVTFDRK